MRIPKKREGKKDGHGEQVLPKEIDSVPVTGGGKTVGTLPPVPIFDMPGDVVWVPETDKALKKSNLLLQITIAAHTIFAIVLLVVAVFAPLPFQLTCLIIGICTILIFASGLLFMIDKEEKRALGKDLPDLPEPSQLRAPDYLPDGGLTIYDEKTDQDLPAHEFYDLQNKRGKEEAEKRYATCYGNYCNIFTKFDRGMARKCSHDCPINTECMTVTTVRLQSKMFKKLGHGETWKGEDADDD